MTLPNNQEIANSDNTLVNLKEKTDKLTAIHTKDINELQDLVDKANAAIKTIDDLDKKSTLENEVNGLLFTIVQLKREYLLKIDRLFFSHGYVFSKYDSDYIKWSGDDSIRELFACLLQGAYLNNDLYPYCHFNSQKFGDCTHSILPELCNLMGTEITEGPKVVTTEEDVKLFVNRINAWHRDHNSLPYLKVSFFGKPIETKKYPNKECKSISLWQDHEKFFVVVPEPEKTNDEADRAFNFVRELKTSLKSVCEKKIALKLGKPVSECDIDSLLACLQTECVKLKNHQVINENDFDIAQLFDDLFDCVQQTEEFENLDALMINSAFYCISNIRNIYPKLSDVQKKKIFGDCLTNYKNSLISCIENELGDRKNKNYKKSKNDENAKKKLALLKNQSNEVDIELNKIGIELNENNSNIEEIICNLYQNNDAKKRRINRLEMFIKNLKEQLINDVTILSARDSYKVKLEKSQLVTMEDCIAFLKQNFKCVTSLLDPELENILFELNQSIDDVEINHALVKSIKAILEGVFKSPDITRLDDRIVIEGNYISWNETIIELKSRIEKELDRYGLCFNEKNKLSVRTYGMLGPINNIVSKQLNDLLNKHIQLLYQHYTVPTEDKKNEQTQRWHKAEETLTKNELENFFEDADIDFTEVLAAFVSKIELKANCNVYLEKGIDLPGISLIINAENNVICQPDITINTSPVALNNSKQPKRASDGKDIDNHDQAKRVTINGTRGDDGLNGLPGQHAGNIVIYANNEIWNLSKLKIIANGTNGLNGQAGGNGGKGQDGASMRDAEADQTTSFSWAHFHAAKGRIPGIDAQGNATRFNEISGPGGDAGRPGYGGLPGNAGDIRIKDKNHKIKLCLNLPEVLEGADNQTIKNNIKRKNGIRGMDAARDALGGEPGEAGKTGADKVNNKPSLFRYAESYTGKLPEDFFDRIDKYVETARSFLGPIISKKNKAELIDDNYFVQRDGFSEKKYQQQISVYRESFKPCFELDEKEYREHPYRNEKSRGRRGKSKEEVPFKASSTIEEPKQREDSKSQIVLSRKNVKQSALDAVLEANFKKLDAIKKQTSAETQDDDKTKELERAQALKKEQESRQTELKNQKLKIDAEYQSCQEILNYSIKINDDVKNTLDEFGKKLDKIKNESDFTKTENVAEQNFFQSDYKDKNLSRIPFAAYEPYQELVPGYDRPKTKDESIKRVTDCLKQIKNYELSSSTANNTGGIVTKLISWAKSKGSDVLGWNEDVSLVLPAIKDSNATKKLLTVLTKLNLNKIITEQSELLKETIDDADKWFDSAKKTLNGLGDMQLQIALIAQRLQLLGSDKQQYINQLGSLYDRVEAQYIDYLVKEICNGAKNVDDNFRDELKGAIKHTLNMFKSKNSDERYRFRTLYLRNIESIVSKHTYDSHEMLSNTLLDIIKEQIIPVEILTDSTSKTFPANKFFEICRLTNDGNRLETQLDYNFYWFIRIQLEIEYYIKTKSIIISKNIEDKLTNQTRINNMISVLKGLMQNLIGHEDAYSVNILRTVLNNYIKILTNVFQLLVDTRDNSNQQNQSDEYARLLGNLFQNINEAINNQCDIIKKEFKPIAKHLEISLNVETCLILLNNVKLYPQIFNDPENCLFIFNAISKDHNVSIEQTDQVYDVCKKLCGNDNDLIQALENIYLQCILDKLEAEKSKLLKMTNSDIEVENILNTMQGVWRNESLLIPRQQCLRDLKCEKDKNIKLSLYEQIHKWAELQVNLLDKSIEKNQLNATKETNIDIHQKDNGKLSITKTLTIIKNRLKNITPANFSEQTVNDLNKQFNLFINTLRMIINIDNETKHVNKNVSYDDVKKLEKQLHSINKNSMYLKMQLKNSHKGIWSEVEKSAVLLKETLNDFYLKHVEDKFNDIEITNTSEINIIDLAIEEIKEHVSSLFKSLNESQIDKGNEEEIAKPAAPKLMTIVNIDGRTVNLYCQFIEFLIAKLLNTLEKTATDNKINIGLELQSIKNEIKNYKNIGDVELALIKAVNILSIKYLKNKIFCPENYTSYEVKNNDSNTIRETGNIIAGLKYDLDPPNMDQDYRKILNSWIRVAHTIVRLLRDSYKNNNVQALKSIKQFSDDSIKLFSMIVLTSEEDEKIIEDIKLELNSVKKNIGRSDAFIKLDDLIEKLELSTCRINKYSDIQTDIDLNKNHSLAVMYNEKWKQCKLEFIDIFKEFQKHVGLEFEDEIGLSRICDAVFATQNHMPLYHLSAYGEFKERAEKIFNEQNEALYKLDPSESLPSDVIMPSKKSIHRLNNINIKKMFDQNDLRYAEKVYLNVKLLRATEISEITEFSRLIKLKLREITSKSKSDCHADICKLIANYLINLNRKKLRDSDLYKDERSMMMLDMAVKMANQKYISLTVYDYLNTTSHDKWNGIDLFNKLVGKNKLTSDTLIETITEVIKNDDVASLNYLIASFPLLPTNILTSQQVDQLVKSLCQTNDANKVVINEKNRFLMLKVLFMYTCENHVYPVIKGDATKRDIFNRVTLTINNKLNCPDTLSLNDEMNAISSCYDILSNLRHDNISINKMIKKGFALQDLLTPVERTVLEAIKSFKKDATIDKSVENQPLKWEITLHSKYFKIITRQVQKYLNCADNDPGYLEFKNLFSTARLAIIKQCKKANSSQADRMTNWHDCINELLDAVQSKKIDANQLNLILKSIIATNSISHVDNVLSMDKHSSLNHTAYLYLYGTLKNHIANKKTFDEILNKLQPLKDALFTADQGYELLSKLATAINNTKDTLRVSYLEQVLTLISKQQIYQDPTIQLRSYFYNWVEDIKRHEIIKEFSLRGRDDTDDTETIIHQLLSMKKNKQLSKIAEIIKPRIGNTSVLNDLIGINNDLLKHKLLFNDQVLEELQNKNISDWHEVLQTHTQSMINCKQDKTLADLVSEMNKELDSNSTIAEFIKAESKYDNKSYIEYIIDKANFQYELKIEKDGKNLSIADWTNADIKSWANNYASRIKDDQSDEAIINYLAVMKKACQLALGITPYPTQLAALLIFLKSSQSRAGVLANISTGEGKSLIAAMTAITCAQIYNHVDVATANEQLAQRDLTKHKPLFELFNLSASNNCDPDCQNNETLRRNRYRNNQIIYGTVSNFQSDYLQTQFLNKPIRGDVDAFINNGCLILDEVDNMFIDNADKTLYISHPIGDLSHLNEIFILIWATIQSGKYAAENNTNIDDVTKLVETQIDEKLCGRPEFLNDYVKNRLRIWVENAYRAKQLKINESYIIADHGKDRGKVVLMDLPTGVEQLNSQWSNGLHQFILLKEGKKLTPESLKAIFISNAMYYQLYGNSIIGMTGTLGSPHEKNVMSKLYSIDKQFVLPRNKPALLQYDDDILVATQEEWLDSIVKLVNDKQRDPEPVHRPALEESEKQRRTTLEQVENHLLINKQALANLTKTSNKSDNPEIEQLKKKIKDNKVSIAALKKDINHIQYQLYHENKQAVLLVNNTVEDTLKIESAIKNDPTLSKKINNNALKITILKSKDDVVPEDEICPNHIIIATNIAGRGTDLKTSPGLEENTGLHVVLTYIPPNIRIEEQAFSRTARNGNRGTCNFIVQDERAADIDSLRYYRDIEENERLRIIETNDIKKLQRENYQLTKFSKLYSNIKSQLEQTFQGQSELEIKLRQLQLDALKNRWALYLVGIENKIEDLEYSDENLEISFVNFASEINRICTHLAPLVDLSVPVKKKDTRPADQKLAITDLLLINEPAMMMKAARLCMNPKIKKPFNNAQGLNHAITYFDEIIKNEQKYAEFAHYYKAYAMLCLNENKLNERREIRHSLKKAVSLIEDTISR